MQNLKSYFAQHPLEDPNSYLGTSYDPDGAAAYRARVRSWRERRRSGRAAAFPAMVWLGEAARWPVWCRSVPAPERANGLACRTAPAWLPASHAFPPTKAE